MLDYYLWGLLVAFFLMLFRGRGQTQRWRREMAQERNKLTFDQSPDTTLAVALLLLMSVGLMSVYSASFIRSSNNFSDPGHFIKNQVIFVGFGLVVLWVTSRINYRHWHRVSFSMWFISLLLLVAVLLFGPKIKGARRWIHLGVMNLQPVEVMKVALILSVSRFVCALPIQSVDKSQSIYKLVRALAPLFFPVGLTIFLLLLQPDYGSILICSSIVIGGYFLVGGPYKLMVPLICGLPVLGMIMYALGFHHVYDRIHSFVQSLTQDPLIYGAYNIRQGMIAFISGGAFGRGLGNSTQRNFFLPEAHTDFIFNIFGEEMGFVGSILLISTYLFIFVRGLKIARNAPTSFGSVVAALISLLFFAQALVNMMMAIGLAPPKGLTLPLVSYGGSSMMIVCLMMGILLNISRRPSEPRSESPLSVISARLDISLLASWLRRGRRSTT